MSNWSMEAYLKIKTHWHELRFLDLFLLSLGRVADSRLSTAPPFTHTPSEIRTKNNVYPFLPRHAVYVCTEDTASATKSRVLRLNLPPGATPGESKRE